MIATTRNAAAVPKCDSCTWPAAILADMLLNKELALETTIGDLPPAARDYPPELRRITVAKIATHSSGLPRLPRNLFAAVKDQANPYATYAPQDLDAFLRTFVPPSDPKPEYPNLDAARSSERARPQRFTGS